MTPAKSLRLAIHAWLANRIPSSIVQIIAAFPGNSVTQVQRAVYLMVDHGNLLSTGQRKGARYSASSKQYKPEVRKTPKAAARYEHAAALRQAAIDYITAHPGAMTPEIVAALGWKKAVGAGRLADMVDRGELSRVDATAGFVNSRGMKSITHTHAYTAIVEKTKSAAKVMEAVEANLESEAKPKAKPETTPGSYVHIGGKRTDLKDQRGQGALPYSVRRGCILGKF